MAETSITINDVVFVVDCGKAKETSYDALNNTPCLLPAWISKASAHQVRLLSLTCMSGLCLSDNGSEQAPFKWVYYYGLGGVG